MLYRVPCSYIHLTGGLADRHARSCSFNVSTFLSHLWIWKLRHRGLHLPITKLRVKSFSSWHGIEHNRRCFRFACKKVHNPPADAPSLVFGQKHDIKHHAIPDSVGYRPARTDQLPRLPNKAPDWAVLKHYPQFFGISITQRRTPEHLRQSSPVNGFWIICKFDSHLGRLT